MHHHKGTLETATTAATDIVDLTSEVAEFVDSSGIREGWALIFVPGSNGAITTLEFESGAVEDLKRAVERLAPADGEYVHNLRWGDGNGYSHVRAALVGPSLTVPVSEGRLVLGTWQQIILCDFDNRPRTRRIEVRVLGLVGPQDH